MWILAAQRWGLSPVLKCGPHTCGHLWLTTDREHLEEAVPPSPDTDCGLSALCRDWYHSKSTLTQDEEGTGLAWQEGHKHSNSGPPSPRIVRLGLGLSWQ